MSLKQPKNRKKRTPLHTTTSQDIIFFIDDAFKRDVQDFFRTSDNTAQTMDRVTDNLDHEFEANSCYEPDADDLAVWRGKIEAESWDCI
jgi:hypothetical protein